MVAYFDTSALIKLYYPEAESEALAEWITENSSVISISRFHEIELCNATKRSDNTKRTSESKNG